MLRVVDTLSPLMIMSARTHHLNFAGDKNKGHIYMTIGNLSWMIRQMASMHTVIMVALLPIPIMNQNIVHNRLHGPWETI
jgi:hypothetical protein